MCFNYPVNVLNWMMKLIPVARLNLQLTSCMQCFCSPIGSAENCDIYGMSVLIVGLHVFELFVIVFMIAVSKSQCLEMRGHFSL